MPTYQYRCSQCGSDLEAVQKFTDAALTECPSCSGELKKVYGNVGVVFKGSGFYATDSRAKQTSSPAKAESTASTSADSSAGSKVESSSNTSAGDKSGAKANSTSTSSSESAA